MKVIAKLKFIRIAPRKVRLVLDLIRGKDLSHAQSQLMQLTRRSSRELLKLLKSAQANAEHNFKLDPKTLFIKQAFADEGPKLKRFQPRAMGRANLIIKRSSHITIVLAQRSEKTATPAVSKPAAASKIALETVKGPPSAPKISTRNATTSEKSKTSGKKEKTGRLSHPGEKWKEKR